MPSLSILSTNNCNCSSKLLPPIAAIVKADVSEFTSSGSSLGLTKPNDLGGHITPLEKSSKNHPNALGKFEKVLAVSADALLKALSGGLAPDFFEKLSTDDWKFNVNANLSAISANMKSRLVLPAGSKFFFKDAIVSPEGHLIMTTTIKN